MNLTPEDRQLIQEINDRSIQTHAIVKGLKEETKTIFKTIEGNGQPGLKQRIAVMETLHRSCQKREESRPSRTSNYIAITAVVMSVLSPIAVIVFQKIWEV